jgi:hypothetical protein
LLTDCYFTESRPACHYKNCGWRTGEPKKRRAGKPARLNGNFCVKRITESGSCSCQCRVSSYRW